MKIRFLKRLVMRILGGKRITEEQLKQLGFKYRNLGGESPYETWEKHGIVIWNFTNSSLGDYWLVDILDQAAIDREFHYMHELGLFFTACGKDIKAA